MNEPSLKLFEVDGRKMVFDTDAFKRVFDRERKKGKKRVGQFEHEIAEGLFVSPDAVHAWRMRQNGPGDLDRIGALAELLGVETCVLLREGDERMPLRLADRQTEALRRIYVSVVEYLDEFERTMGFNDLWFERIKAGTAPEHIEDELYELADARQHAVRLAADKERFDLHGLPVYDAVLDLIDDDLVGIYDGKLSYAYRLEAPVEAEDGMLSGVQLEDDLERAWTKVDEIFGLR